MPRYHDLIIGTVRIDLDAAYSIRQTYTEIGGRSLRRMLDGSARLQHHWRRLRTEISGQGRLPAGIANLDTSAAQTIYCMAPRAAYSSSTSVAIPAADKRRTDWAPHAYAHVDGRMIATPVVASGTSATCTAVAGASGYTVNWYPVLTCYIEPPQTTFDGRGTVAGWTLIAEEV